MTAQRSVGAILAALILGAAAPALAQEGEAQSRIAPPQAGQGMGPGMMGQGMGPGMMGPGMMDEGPGHHHGMEHHGMMSGMHHGMMGGHGSMRSGMPEQGMGPGAMAGQHMLRVVPMMHLSTDDVRHFLEHHIRAHGLQHLEIGEVEQTDDETITAEVVTTEGSLAMRLSVDPHTGWVVDVE